MSIDSTNINYTAHTVKLKYTASLSLNNCTVSTSNPDQQYIAYLHKNDIYIVHNNNSLLHTIDRCESTHCSYINIDKSYITHIQYIKQIIKGVATDILCILNDHGTITLYNVTGATQLYQYTVQLTNNATQNNHTVLNCVAGNGSDTIYVGGNNGLLVTLKNQQYEQQHILNTSHIYTTCIYHDKYKLIGLGNSTGQLLILDVNNDRPEIKHTYDTTCNIPITSCNTLSDYIITTSHNGTITLISLTSNIIYCTIQSHCKSITGLCINKDTNQLITCSEDSYISMWQLQSDHTMRHINSYTPHSGLLTGVQLLNQEYIVVTCYDSRYLYIVNLS